MAYQQTKKPQLATIGSILGPEKPFFVLAAIYGVGIAILTLAVPVAVQALINTVVNTALVEFIALLAGLLLVVLLLSVIMIACRDYVIEIFQRRFLARITSEIALRLTHAHQPHMDGINRAELVNRFFEVMPVQKNVASLMTEGFLVALQAIVGLIVVSFYHPFLFAYNVLFVGMVVVIWKTWARKAIRQSVALSDSKYALAQWLEEIARVNQMFKSERSITHALKETDNKTARYLALEKSYFRATFGQSLAFLLLYCFSSAVLLGLGGILVAKNQLSLGQLIGAELIMSAVFYATSKLGYYALIYYDLRANLHKISYFFKLPLEENHGTLEFAAGNTTPLLALDKVFLSYRGHEFNFNLDVASNSKILAKSNDAAGSKLLVDLLKAYRQPLRGRILLGEQDLRDFDTHKLRNKVLSIDNFSAVEGSILHFFNLYAPELSSADIIAALQVVELDKIVDSLPDGFDTHLVPSGYPLLQDELVRLKLAAALAAQPRILIITEIFDAVPFAIRKRIMQTLCNRDMTLFCFTNRKEWGFFDRYLVIDRDASHSFNTLADLKAHEDLQAQDQ